MYSVKSDSWTETAPLNVGRINASGCSLSNMLYVFCGYARTNSFNQPIESIEAMDA